MQKTIRASSLNSYNDCALRAFANNYSKLIESFGYVLNEPKNGVASVFGTACHAGFSYALENKKLAESVKSNDIIDLAINDFDVNFGLSNEFLFDKMTPNMNTAYSQIQRTSKLFELFVLDTLEPELVEERFYLKLKNDFVLSGQMDEVESEINDFKTGNEGNFTGQFGGYALLLAANGHGVKQTANGIYIPRNPKIKQPYKISYNTKNCVNVARNTINNMINDYSELEEKKDTNILRCNSTSMMCSKQYCRAYGTEACKNTSFKTEKIFY